MNTQLNRFIKIANHEVIPFDVFFKANYSKFYLFANRFIKDEGTCQDIAQDVFLELWESNSRSFESTHTLQSFLYKTVKNRCLNHFRHCKVKDRYTSEQTVELISDEYLLKHIVEIETNDMIHQAIDSLTPKNKQVIECHMLGLKNKDIAEELGIQLSTVKSHKMNAFKLLRKQLHNL
jgi:RNA polymerase sigma-70 factor (ECF subfamily)